MKPNYCTTPDVPECIYCSLVNYGLDCYNNPIQKDPEDGLSKYQRVYAHPEIAAFAQSEKAPHLDALETAGLLEKLDADQCAIIIKLMQSAYRNGQSNQGAEKIDNDCVWINGIGGIEKQTDGTWKLTMPDKPGIVAASVAASALGSVSSEKKARSSRENGKKGGRPKKDKS